jgi:hypothetical protein
MLRFLKRAVFLALARAAISHEISHLKKLLTSKQICARVALLVRVRLFLCPL